MRKKTAKKKRTTRKKKRTTKIVVNLLMLIMLMAATIFGGYYLQVKNELSKWDKVIYPRVKVEGVNLTGKTKEEAMGILEQKFGQPALKKKIYINTPNKTYKLDYSKLKVKFNIDKTVEEAFNYGKNLGILDKYRVIKKQQEKELKLIYSYDKSAVKDIVASIEKDINVKPQNAKIEVINGGMVKVVPDKKGVKLISDKLEKDILAEFNGGLKVEVNINAEIKDSKAVITADKLSMIDGKISTYSTNFSTSIPQRINNITLATKSINGILLMPGETFSFNNVVGERTAARGYKEAGVVLGSKVESGLGGGICQVSSTLYNALLLANIKAIERKPHTIPSSYVPKGCDATVDYGNIDYKFKNTLTYPIYIEGHVQNKNLYFNIYSNSSLLKRKYEVFNEIYETIQPKVKEVPDSTLAAGNIVIEQQPLIGYKVKVYRKVLENGKVINTELISNDFYKPVDGIKKLGIKRK